MPIGAAIAGAGSIGGALIGANASKSASEAQMQFGQQALGQQQAMSQQGLQTLLEMFRTAQGTVQPVIEAGGNVLRQGQSIVSPVAATLQGLLTPGANQTALLSQLPGFQFAQDWGQRAVQNLGTTTGLGGNTLKAGADYATGAAQQGFGGLVDRLQALLSGGAGLVGSGLGAMSNSANALATGAINAGNSAFGNLNQAGATMGGTLTGIGNAGAAGILGTGNAIQNGLNGGLNAYPNSLILSKFLGGGASGAGGGIYGGAGQTMGPGGLPAIY